MAIPTDYFKTKWGIALMYYDNNLSEWFFLCWANKAAYSCNLGAGSFKFALWLINGESGPSYLQYNGWSLIAVQRARK